MSLSGGEPLLYSGFEALASHAVDLGYQLNLISNGAPVTGYRLELICEFVHLIALSLDDSPDTHIQMRGHNRAFDYVEQAIMRLTEVGQEFGLAYCVSRQSLGEIPWAYEFARKNQAQSLPLVEVPFGMTN